MNNEAKLERYLAALDKALGAVAISERAEIITEIKSHIHSALERERSLDHVLSALGEPEAVANRYLLERGLRTVRPHRGGTILKWMVIGTLGIVVLAMLGVGFLIWRFSPIIQVNESKGQVRLFGGLIDVDDAKGSLKIGQHILSDDMDMQSVGGAEEIQGTRVKEVRVPFNNGKFQVMTSQDGRFRWMCKGLNGGGTPNVVTETLASQNQAMVLKLTETSLSKCTLEIPKNILLQLTGLNGKVNLERPQGPVVIDLQNGKVNIEPDPARAYSYDVKVINGKVDEFINSASTTATPIKVSVGNGVIRNGDER